jgi:hypothetical protein
VSNSHKLPRVKVLLQRGAFFDTRDLGEFDGYDTTLVCLKDDLGSPYHFGNDCFWDFQSAD